jgi:signal transduction histidine kinase
MGCLRIFFGNPMKNLFKKNSLYFIVTVISVLLAASIILTYYNNSIIERNQALRTEVETAKFYFDQIGKSTIHSLDIGLRGFAIIRHKKFSEPMDKAQEWRDSLMENTEAPLRRLGYNFAQYNVFKDSVLAYVRYCFRLKDLLVQGKDDEFRKIFAQDKGAHLWWQYLETEKDIRKYIDSIDQQARMRYEAALFRNEILQIILFLTCVPTLIFTAFFTGKSFQLSELLRQAQKEKNRILREQNVLLEHKVVERTHEIAAQNEEIVSQSEELSAQRDTLLLQNQKLQDAGNTIYQQNTEIKAANEHLLEEVNNRTQELQKANRELIEQNNQLEQFAFIAAHNLRAPLARILGLTNLIKISSTEGEKQLAFEKLELSTRDLDHVIKDLNIILNIQKHTSNLTEVDLTTSFARVKRTLEKEMEDTNTVLTAHFDEASSVFAVAPYVESIFYNLISNAIKYRDPARQPAISLETHFQEDYVLLLVKDNGLGIDLEKYKSSMFSLYKRFHLHMEGKGLGLYLVKTQIEAMGGKIEVQSEPNKGTIFMVYFKPFHSTAHAFSETTAH